MEIRFVSIAAFRTALDNLLKVKKGVYASVPQEICKAFQNISIEQIRQNRDMILMDNDSITIKLRLPDKKQRLSKADGYRLIYMVMKNLPVVGLLTVYPKRGPMQKLDLEDGELEMLMNAFSLESQTQQVVVHDINNNLKVIPKSE
jgi:mRNA-degrading endonuclease RelE of RelBE toxin-antitoxin system